MSSRPGMPNAAFGTGSPNMLISGWKTRLATTWLPLLLTWSEIRIVSHHRSGFISTKLIHCNNQCDSCQTIADWKAESWKMITSSPPFLRNLRSSLPVTDDQVAFCIHVDRHRGKAAAGRHSVGKGAAVIDRELGKVVGANQPFAIGTDDVAALVCQRQPDMGA